MQTLIGDIVEDIITLPNKMVIKIEYGDNDLGAFGIGSRYTAKHRRVQLFDKKQKLITELIEENPHKETIPTDSFNVNTDGDIL